MKNKPWKIILPIFIVGIILSGCAITNKQNEVDNDSLEFVESESKIDDIIGDWYGSAEIHSEYNEGTFEAILSINSDGQWASCVNGKVDRGTWECASESTNRLILTVEYDGIDATNIWSFEKKTDGKYYYDYVYMEDIPIEMTKMENESKDQLFGDWQGKTIHTFDDGEEREVDASLSVNADNSWSSSVSGSANFGYWSYISEAGHLVVLTVEYEGTDTTNTWALKKGADGQYYYEYVYMEGICIPVVKM